MTFFARSSIAFLLLMWGCPPAPIVPQPDADATVPPAPDVLDASVPPVDDAGDIDEVRRPKRDALTPSTDCGRACANLAWIGCSEGLPTPKGESCESVCLRTNAFPGMALPTSCAIKATSIEQARACPRIKCR